MKSAYKYFEKKYLNSQKAYLSTKKEKELFFAENGIKKETVDVYDVGSLVKSHKGISLSLSHDRMALRMIIDKYDLYKEENNSFLSRIEKNDIYNLFHFAIGDYEKAQDFLPSVLELESKSLKIKPSIIIGNFLQDRERLYFMKVINKYELDVNKITTEMKNLTNYQILEEFQSLTDWFNSVGVVDNKEKLLIILASLSKILYAQKIKSSKVPDMTYIEDLSKKMLQGYSSPEFYIENESDEDLHLKRLKTIHILSFFASQLTY